MKKQNFLSSDYFSFFIPWLFVLLWSTGFIFSKLGLNYAPPFAFLSLRYLALIFIMLIICICTKSTWPKSNKEIFHIALSGFFLHGLYLIGVMGAIHFGLATGITALIVGFQPLLTAFISNFFLKESLNKWQWLGIIFGLIGILIVLYPKLGFHSHDLNAVGFAIIGLLGITFGTLYQKYFCPKFDLRTGGLIQYLTAGLFTFPLSFLFGNWQIKWDWLLIFSLAWLVIILSVGAISLLSLLIRHNKASSVASLFYLVPPLTSIEAYIVFKEKIYFYTLVGMGLTIIGVILVIHSTYKTITKDN
ncbi:MAG: DMT family transporter [Alphaproteobacteria bacterium]|nr:DMT family transporter [Alphaproteobacteria bacterium]